MSDLHSQDLAIESDSNDPSNYADQSQESTETKQRGGRKALSPELFAQSPIDAYKRLLNLFSAIGVSDAPTAQSIVGDAFTWQSESVTQSLEEQFSLLSDEMKQAFLAKIGIQSGEPVKAKATNKKPTITTTLSVE